MIVMFLGTNFEGIRRDVLRQFPDEPILLITRDQEALPIPGGVDHVLPVSRLRYLPMADRMKLIANGGMSQQLVPTLLFLTNSVGIGVPNRSLLEVYDVQKDSTTLLASYDATSKMELEVQWPTIL